MPRFFHYCCRHSAAKITARGFLRPNDAAGMFGAPLIWLTDQAVPDREGLGLTTHYQPCDRLAYQYTVDVDAGVVEPWLDSDIRARLARDATFRDFEAGRNPATWFIARRRLYAVQNRAYVRPAA